MGVVEPVLVVEVASCRYALPLLHVRETFRPLPLESVSNAPDYILGMAIVRGTATPVIDLARLLGSDNRDVRARWVRIAVEQRDVVLAVDATAGVRTLDAALVASLPPLLQEVDGAQVSALGRLDDRLLRVLRGGLTLPEEVWSTINTSKAST